MRRLLAGGPAHGQCIKGDNLPWHWQVPTHEVKWPDDDPLNVSFELTTYELRKMYEVREHPCIRNTVLITIWQVYVVEGVEARSAITWAKARGYEPDGSEFAVGNPLVEHPPVWIYDDPGTTWFIDSVTGEYGGRMYGQAEEE